MDLFGGIATGLVATLQVGIKVRKNLYVDNNIVAQKIAQAHIEKLRRHYPDLLSIEATLVSFTALAQDVLLIEEDQLQTHGPVDVVIAGWPYQGLSMAGNQNGLQDK